MARPVKYTKEKLKEIEQAIEEYIETTDIPIIAEFAYKNKIPRQKLYEFEELNDAIKELIDKKEAQLERKALKGEVNNTMAVFSLKQIGWRDKPKDEEHDESFKKFADAIRGAFGQK